MRLLCLLAISAACGPAVVANDDDQGGQPDGSGSADGSGVYVYAHTATTLYRIDPDTLAISQIAPFKWPAGADEMTDIAVDKTGGIVGVSETKVYRIDPTTAGCTLLTSGLQGAFNGLSFVPAETIGATGDDVLVGTRGDDGIVDRINPMTGAVTVIGNMGGSFTSSGDLVAIVGFGTVQTTVGSTSDVLARLAPTTFAATAVGATGHTGIFGLAFWKGKVFGFSEGGELLTIDPNTGAATVVQRGGPAWWGAGVTTVAPVLL